MQTTFNSIEGKRVRTLEADPQYFGGYLNMARHNIYSINNHVAEKLGIRPLNDEGNIKNSFLLKKDHGKEFNWNLAYSMTVRFMPVIKVFNFEELPKSIREDLERNKNVPAIAKDFERMRQTLVCVFGEICDFRNDYSHYDSTEEGFERKLVVSAVLADFLKSTFKLAIEYTKERMKDVLKVEDFNLAGNMRLVDDDNKITVEGLVFLICMFLEREQAYQFIGKVHGLKGTQYRSFIATREVFMAFCVKLPHDKFVSENQKDALTLDMINELNRCPKKLYDVITDEGKKRFRPEFDVQKQQNLIDNSLNQTDLCDWDEPSYDEYIEQFTKRIRHKDRFYYFALRFIDEMNLFKVLRFHIDIGKVELASYPKQLAGETEQRRIVENVVAFGKLSDFNDEQRVLEEVGATGSILQFEQFAPKYNMVNNKIGLSSKCGTAKVKARGDNSGNVKLKLVKEKPEAFLSLHMLPGIILLEYLKEGEAERIIQSFIKLNKGKLLTSEFIDEIKRKLPNDWGLLKREYNSKDGSDYPKKKMIEEIKSRKAALNDVLKEYGLNDKQIPSRMLHHWLNIDEGDKNKLFSDRIALMRQECIDRLKVMKSHKNDPGRRIPKVGEMATFLAKDIVKMIIDEDKKNKITSFYYDKMQKCLAFYADEEEKGLFKQIINELGLLGEGGHPFLRNVMDCKPARTRDFYEVYLSEKGYKPVGKGDKSVGTKDKTGRENGDASWISSTFYKRKWDEAKSKKVVVVKMPEDRSNIPHTIRTWIEKEESDLDRWLENVSGKFKKPVDLPVNLFDDKIRELLVEKLKEAEVSFDLNLKENELFKKWWETREDSTQDFYRFEREYVVYGENVRFFPDTKSSFRDYYKDAFDKVIQSHHKESIKPDDSLKRVFKRAIAGTEREIRKLQDEDRLMLLMIEQLMLKDRGVGSINMENLSLAKVDQLLNETIDIELTLHFNESGKVIASKNGATLSRTIRTSGKRKDYTKLLKYRYDRRLPDLLEYHDANEVDLDWLKRQLASYNKVKQLVFDLVFDLEKAIIDVDREGVMALFVDKEGQPKRGNIQHWPYLDWLANEGLINKNEKKFLNDVRNAFSHNQFPKKKDIFDMVKLNNVTPIAEQILSAYGSKVGEIIDTLSQLK